MSLLLNDLLATRMIYYLVFFLGDGNVTGKFELVYEDEEDNSEKPELDPKVEIERRWVYG